MQVVNAAPSSAHWKVAEGTFEVKLKVAEVAFVGLAGWAMRVVSGTTVETVKTTVAEVADVLPAMSVAVAVRLCDPSASDVAGVKLQLPVPLAETVPSSVPWSLSFTV